MSYRNNIFNLSQVNNLMLAGSSNKPVRWKNELRDYAQVLHVKNLHSLKTELVRAKPHVLLLDHDLPELEGASGIVGLRKLSPDTKIVVLIGSATDEEDEWAFFRAGVRGCCRHDIDPALLKTLISAVHQGELWIRRTLTERLLDQLGATSIKKNGHDLARLSLLASLTEREYEISVRVSNGENNKQIAESLEITERTVKAHLTEVYRKLGVADRLRLAVILSGDKRQVRRSFTRGNGTNK